MKAMIRFVGVVAVGASLLVASSAFAGGGFGGGRGGGHGGYGWYGGWGWGMYPAVSLAYGWPYYYNYAPYYYAPDYYAPATVIYSAQPQVVYSSPTVNYTAQPVVDNSQPTAPAPAPSVQNQPAQPNTQKQPMTVADIKTLAKAGLSDEVILSQIRSNRTVFHLTTEEIIDLNTNKVSQKVIEFMINTASQR